MGWALTLTFRYWKCAATAPVRGPLSLPEIAQMAQQQISDQVIIAQIRTTRSVYNLTPSDIQWLKQSGVSDAVVMEMQATANRYPRRVYTEAPVYAEPVYVVEQPPPPVAIANTFFEPAPVNPPPPRAPPKRNSVNGTK